MKGCTNITCAAYHKRTQFKKTDDFCSKCGQPLSYVCKKCHTPVDGASIKYCLSCAEEMAAKREMMKEKAVKAGKVAMQVGEVAIKVAPVVVPAVASLPVVKKIAPKIQKALPVIEKAAPVIQKVIKK